MDLAPGLSGMAGPVPRADPLNRTCAIIPSWNGRHLLPFCLDALQRQEEEMDILIGEERDPLPPASGGGALVVDPAMPNTTDATELRQQLLGVCFPCLLFVSSQEMFALFLLFSQSFWGL